MTFQSGSIFGSDSRIVGISQLKCNKQNVAQEHSPLSVCPTDKSREDGGLLFVKQFSYGDILAEFETYYYTCDDAVESHGRIWEVAHNVHDFQGENHMHDASWHALLDKIFPDSLKNNQNGIPFHS